MTDSQFSLRRLLIAFTGAAIAMTLFDWRHWHAGSAAVLLTIVIVASFATRRMAVTTGVIVAGAYLPYAWLLGGRPWSDYEWHWIGLWPLLPGLIPGAYLFHGVNETLEIVAMATTTIFLLTIATTLAARGRWWLVMTGIIVLALSAVNSFGVYAAFRA